MDYLSSVRERPAWQTVPAEVKQSLSRPVPHEPCALESVYADFRQQILPYPTGNIHPRFWGWVMGTGTPVAILAEMLASGMNSWVGGFDQSATLVEEQVLSWLTDMLGFPQGTSGVTDERVHGRKHIKGCFGVAGNRQSNNVRKEGLQNHTHAPYGCLLFL